METPEGITPGDGKTVAGTNNPSVARAMVGANTLAGTLPGARKLAHFLVVLLFVLIFVAFLGALIYVLYKIALTDRNLYSYLFLAAFAGFLFYLAARGLKRRKLKKALQKILKFFLGVTIFSAIIASLLLYAALCIRNPLIGALVLPLLVGVFLYLKLRVHFFAQVKNIFHKL